MSILLTYETSHSFFAEDSSEAYIITPFMQTISDITSFGTKQDTTIQAFQIFWFLEGAPIPNSGGLTIKRNIVAEVLYTRDGMIIRAGDVDEEGFGVTLHEASDDFLTSLNDKYNSLIRREGRLSEHDLSVLNTLRRVLH